MNEYVFLFREERTKELIKKITLTASNLHEAVSIFTQDVKEEESGYEIISIRKVKTNECTNFSS